MARNASFSLFAPPSSVRSRSRFVVVGRLACEMKNRQVWKIVSSSQRRRFSFCCTVPMDLRPASEREIKMFSRLFGRSSTMSRLRPLPALTGEREVSFAMIPSQSEWETRWWRTRQECVTPWWQTSNEDSHGLHLHRHSRCSSSPSTLFYHLGGVKSCTLINKSKEPHKKAH